MDLPPIHHQQEATTSTTSNDVHHSTDNITISAEPRPTRSSARVRAAKQKPQTKGKGKERDSPSQGQSTSASTAAPPQETPHSRITRTTPSKRSRESTLSKGKAKELPEEIPTRNSKRARRSTGSVSTSITINEPAQDCKGKKRAIAEPDDEDTSPAKRPRTSGYSLRSSTTLQTPDMPRKSRSSTGAKDKAVLKSKYAAGSSRHEDEDVEMLDADVSRQEHSSDEEENEEQMNIEGDGAGRAEDREDDHNQGDMDDGDADDEDGDDGDEGDAHGGDLSSSLAAGLGLPAGLDEAAALAIFGDYRQFGSYMMSLSSRLKTMLNNIKATADPTTRLLTLQELSELLSMSTEDTLAGSFQVEQFVKELVRILGGTGAAEDEDGDDDEDGEQNEDAALAAALAMSTGGVFQGDENLEAQVLACRCLANLMEALPGVAHTVVYHGAIPVLCSKLIEISYIDLAEQTLSTMEKISEEFPSAIVREGGLVALLNYLDFFSIAVQRTALQAAANCCRNVSADHFPMIRGVWSIIRGCLMYSDQRLVEYACSCVIRVIESYHRSSVENLESLVDADLIGAVNQLLLPAGGSPLIAQNTFTQLLRALATCAKASPKITMTLLEADIVDTLYQILTGVLPSAGASDEQGDGSHGQGLGGGLADMAVMQNLAHRPKEQIDEALALVSELMPPLPKDGVFDNKAYTEKALSRLIKAKAKADKLSARAAAASVAVGEQDSARVTLSAGSSATSLSVDVESSPAPSDRQPQEADDFVGEPASITGETPSPAGAPVALSRTELLRSKPVVVGKFMQLLVPILIDVYAASVAIQVRTKSLTALLKAVSFLDADTIKQVLTFVPVASFASSILSSKDHPHLVLYALQLVDLLLSKVSSLYKPAFRREGVFHEIEAFAARQLNSSKAKDKEKQTGEGTDATPTPPVPSIAPIPGFRKLAQTMDPEDAITLRSRVIQFKYLTGDAGEDDADDAFKGLRRLVERVSAPKAEEKELSAALWELADLFASPRTSVSSFELLQSGVVDGLLQFVTEGNRNVDIQRRKELFIEAFAARRPGNLGGGQTPFSTLVKKLQESLTRMESFEVITVNQNSDDSKRSSPSLLARQMRLRLVAGDDSDIPRNLHNIVVSIHAIATFQALHDYLRPRVAGLLSSGARLSGMFAALAASGFAASSRNDSDETLQSSKTAPVSTGAGSTSNTPSVGRRRSQRLSAKNASTSGEEAPGAESSQPAPPIPATLERSETAPDSSGAVASEGENDPMLGSALEADFTDDEVDADVFDDDADADNSADKTVSVSVADDGSKVVAQTPEGTRVATPNSTAKDSSISPAQRKTSSSKPSYAAALKTKPSDWHLEFSMDDHVLPLDLTIYGAIHQHENRKMSSMSSSMLWQSLYTVKFKKVPGPAPTHENDGSKVRPSSPTLSSLPEDAPHAKILRLLRALYRINVFESERSAFIGDKRNLPESAFVNNKLSAKLTRQLEEPMIVASSCLPDWALDLPQHFPFLFPFATRYNFLQSTSFGYARLILKWQSQQNRGQDNSRRDDQIAFLGRLQRQKVRVSRKHILESAMKVFELYGSSSSILEVEYFEEVGTGLGPTLEFYSLVSKEFARKDLKVWRDSDSIGSGVYVHHPNGLYPAPISPEEISNDGGEKRTHILRVIGQFAAKAMLDSRIIDMTFNKVFLKLILGEEVPLTIATLKLVDVELANSLLKIQNIVANRSNPTDKLSKKLAQIEGVNVEDLALDFTIPGYDIELKPGGRDIAVTSENVQEYINEVLSAILGKGVQLQINAFKEGFSKVFPVADLKTFTADELVMLFGNSDEDWSVETLSEALKADHGFNVESRAIRYLIEIMSKYDQPTRRAFLQFITGSPKLPIGGFRGLNPPLTVVRKPHDAPLTADDYLPSVMTCVNYLKLPEYSSKEVMREKLGIAMQEGVGSFHLS